MVLSLGEITPLKANIPSLLYLIDSPMASLCQDTVWDLFPPLFRNITHILPSE